MNRVVGIGSILLFAVGGLLAQPNCVSGPVHSADSL